MIEIIREENWDDTKEKKLPKDIRQIGRPDVGERIYIEDEVYRYLHPYESSCEKTCICFAWKIRKLQWKTVHICGGSNTAGTFGI